MTWKEEIGSYFAESGVYRLKYLYQNMLEGSNELKKYLEEFDGVFPDVTQAFYTQNYKSYPCIWIKVRNKWFDNNYSFHLCLYYCPVEDSSNYCLMMIWTTKITFGAVAGAEWLKNYNLTPDDQQNFKWEREEITGAEICEKEYVLQLIINRMKKFYDQSLSMSEI